MFEQLIDCGLVSEFVKRPESGVRINLVGGQTLLISGDKAKTIGQGSSVAFVFGQGKLWRFDQIGQYGDFWQSYGKSLGDD